MLRLRRFKICTCVFLIEYVHDLRVHVHNYAEKKNNYKKIVCHWKICEYKLTNKILKEFLELF